MRPEKTFRGATEETEKTAADEEERRPANTRRPRDGHAAAMHRPANTDVTKVNRSRHGRVEKSGFAARQMTNRAGDMPHTRQHQHTQWCLVAQDLLPHTLRV